MNQEAGYDTLKMSLSGWFSRRRIKVLLWGKLHEPQGKNHNGLSLTRPCTCR